MATAQDIVRSEMAMRQQSSAPTRKVVAAGVIGAGITIVIWIVNTYKLLPQGQQIPAEVATAFTTVVSFIVSYFVPPAPEDQLVQSTG